MRGDLKSKPFKGRHRVGAIELVNTHAAWNTVAVPSGIGKHAAEHFAAVCHDGAEALAVAPRADVVPARPAPRTMRFALARRMHQSHGVAKLINGGEDTGIPHPGPRVRPKGIPPSTNPCAAPGVARTSRTELNCQVAPWASMSSSRRSGSAHPPSPNTTSLIPNGPEPNFRVVVLVQNTGHVHVMQQAGVGIAPLRFPQTRRCTTPTRQSPCHPALMTDHWRRSQPTFH